ncbi:MAG: hypothetical protein KME49_12125 [Brasilonema octagenarum HA4186-MV1]|jgi:hypothetical protein|nr:hypothetical protein [Brasilonema octagenarum HA4186-MV1]
MSSEKTSSQNERRASTDKDVRAASYDPQHPHSQQEPYDKKESSQKQYGSDLMHNAEQIFQNITNELAGAMRLLLNQIPLEPEVIREMTYEASISYFVTQRPRDPRVAKGAMLRQPHPKGELFLQVFLDKNNELICGDDGNPFGRQVIVIKFDSELMDTFGTDSLVIVE